MNQPAICYLFGAGEHFLSPPSPGPADCVIAVDGGLQYLRQHQIAPTLVVGDFDSLPFHPPEGETVITLPREKDMTDMAAALQEGWRRGYRIFHLYGGTGGRLDHTLANLQCLADVAVRGGQGFLLGRDTVLTALHQGRITFPASAQGILSVFAHTDRATGIWERGLKYPLANATLSNTNPLGVSNEFIGQPSSVSVETGVLILCYPRQV